MKLEMMPRCGRIVPEMDSYGFREVIYQNYRKPKYCNLLEEFSSLLSDCMINIMPDLLTSLYFRKQRSQANLVSLGIRVGSG